MPKTIKIASFVRDRLKLIKLIRFHNRIFRRLNRFFHKVQFFIEWRLENPEYFEHQMDLNFKWHETRTSFPMERGVFSSFALRDELPSTGNTLDLCCGDGFYSYYFYSKRSKKVTAIDFDRNAIEFAVKNYGLAGNIDFVVGDIRSDIPEGPFDNVIWDAAIEHFTEHEIENLMLKIKKVMKTKIRQQVFKNGFLIPLFLSPHNAVCTSASV
jgi:SAM-dependent methyltransferase